MNPTVFAAIIGFVGILTGNLLGPALARLTARGQRRIQRQDDASAAKITTDQREREFNVETLQEIIKGLRAERAEERAEMAELRQALQRREAQLDGLIEDQKQWHAIERQLRAENVTLRAKADAQEREIVTLRERIRTLEGQLAGVALVPPPQAQP